MAKTAKTTENALVPYTKGTAIVNRAEQAEKARGYAEKALSEGTRKLYAECWEKYVAWCDINGASFLPSNPATLMAYFMWLHEGQQGNERSGQYEGRYPKGYVISNARMDTIWSAINHYHEKAGYPLSKIKKDAAFSHDDRERRAWAALQDVRDGIRRTIAETQTIRRVRPISDLEVREMIEMMRPDMLADSRDAAILAVGFGGCRRRSEVVCLDYLERGKTKGSKGYITITDDKSVILHIQSSKTNKTGKNEEYPIYYKHARILCEAIHEWIKLSKPKPGDPLFKSALRARGTARSNRPKSGYKGVYWFETPQGKGCWYARYTEDDKRKLLDSFDDPREAHIALCKKTGESPRDPFDPSVYLKGRLDGQTVAEIVKNRYRQLRRQKYGKKLTEEQKGALDAAADEVSGHSMRAGYITTAALHGHSANVIRKQSGHASNAMVEDNYIRIQIEEKTSSQKGMRLS